MPITPEELLCAQHELDRFNSTVEHVPDPSEFEEMLRADQDAEDARELTNLVNAHPQPQEDIA